MGAAEAQPASQKVSMPDWGFSGILEISDN
jgi:hypothetical protein